jgi:hypothetical protein
MHWGKPQENDQVLSLKYEALQIISKCALKDFKSAISSNK